MGAGLEVFFSVKPLFGSLVESLEVRDVGRRVDEVRERVVKFGNKHTELGSPISNVVHTVDLVAKELKNAAN